MANDYNDRENVLIINEANELELDFTVMKSTDINFDMPKLVPVKKIWYR